MTAGVRVTTAYPADWRRQPDLPLLATRPWQQVMGGRLEGDPAWFWTEQPSGGIRAGLAGFVIRGPASYPLSDAVHLVSDPGSPFADAAPQPPDVAVPELYPYLLVTHPGYATFPVGDRRDDADAVGDLLDGMLGWAVVRGLHAVALAFTETSSPLAEAAARLDFRGPRLTTDSRLAVPGTGFAGYLAALPAHRRRRLRSERRALHAAGLRGERVQRITAPLLDRLTELRCQHRRKYGLVADHEAERSRLAATVDGLSDRTDVFVVRSAAPGAPIVCYGLFVRDGHTWHAVYTGSDYGDPASRTAYFEAVYYAPVDAAGPLGITEISYGLAADRAKQLRGCHAVPVSCLLRGLTREAEDAVDRVGRAWQLPRPRTAESLRGRRT
jgi:hypothetical protein